jgi:L-alanine-DL-glutamate epimerase-like enolase superfamily enzyme
MKITGVEILGISLPLKKPFVIAYEFWEAMPSILVRLETDEGLEGWGEAVPDPLVSGETYASCLAMLRDDLAPHVLGLDPTDVAGLHAALGFVRGAPAAKAALDIACHDILGKAQEKPLWELLGGADNPLELPMVISLLSPGEQATEAALGLARGFRQFKVKLGQGWHQDSQRILAVREALGPEPVIRVDANQGWNREDAVKMLPSLREAGVAVLEQPLAWWDVEGLALLNREIIVMADEAVLDLHDFQRVLALGACRMLNIKLMKCGGLFPAVKLAEVAREAGIPVLVGSMLESAVGSLAGAHLAAGVLGVVANEMVGPGFFGLDSGSFPQVGKEIYLSNRPGLGFIPCRQNLEKLSIIREFFQ